MWNLLHGDWSTAVNLGSQVFYLNGFGQGIQISFRITQEKHMAFKKNLVSESHLTFIICHFPCPLRDCHQEAAESLQRDWDAILQPASSRLWQVLVLGRDTVRFWWGLGCSMAILKSWTCDIFQGKMMLACDQPWTMQEHCYRQDQPSKIWVRKNFKGKITLAF